MRPLRSGEVELELSDSFWGPALRTNRRQTLYHCWDMCEKTGRLANFAKAAARNSGNGAGKDAAPFEGLFFNDSDVYKLAEGTAYAVRDSKDDFMELRLADLTRMIAAAQRPDGYLNTYYQLGDLSQRWTDLPQKHELYCLGHLMEAGVAGWEALGSRSLLDVSKRASGHLRSIFGPGKRSDVCGHPEIELALQRLYDVTGDPGDRDLATWFIEQRGQSAGRASAGEYAQDHLPIRQQQEAVGHAVRAAYLYTAATRLARESGDAELAEAMRRLFADVTERKMYLTGGIGSSAANEGFTTAFDLPLDDGYAETCASIALLLWAEQMHLLDRDARAMDVLERALYNAVRGGVSLDGVKFFYANPLASRGSHHRQSWFDCACCPPNILRILGRLNEFVASRDGETLYINLYAQGTVATTFERAAFQVTQRTDYPWSGDVKLWITGSRPATFTLALRIPSWTEGAEEKPRITIDGKPAEFTMERGYAMIRRQWETNNTVDLVLPMPVRVVQPDPRVESHQGRFALQRGPLVYCVEGVDSAADLRSLVFDPAGSYAAVKRDDLLGGVMAITGTATRQAMGDRPAEPVPFTAVPFYAWDNRTGAGEPNPMMVWLPTSPAQADPPIDPSRRSSASHCWDRDTVQAMADGEVPADRSPRFTWWPRQGSTEWVQYDFDGPRTIAGVEMAWFDDLDQGGGCAMPKSVAVMVRRAGSGAWEELARKPLVRPAAVGPDGASAPRTRVEFPPISVQGVRLECGLRDGRSGGLLEWELLAGP